MTYQAVRRVGSGRGPWGCGARATALGVVVGCAQHVQAECYRGSGAVTAYGRVARGGSSARVRMYTWALLTSHRLSHSLDSCDSINRADGRGFGAASGCKGGRGGGRCHLHVHVVVSCDYCI